MQNVSEKLLREATRRLIAEFKPEQIILFGPHAWGSPGPDSDLDLLVIIPESQEAPAARATRAYRSLRGLKAPADILVKTRAEMERFASVPASLENRILHDGRKLYG